jgi:hypothetical protein
VQLLGLHKRSRGSSSQSGARRNLDDNSDRQVDVSFPPAKLEGRIDMTRIPARLRIERDRITVESKLNESENEYFRRATLVLQQINGIEFYCIKISRLVLFRCDKITRFTDSYNV